LDWLTVWSSLDSAVLPPEYHRIVFSGITLFLLD